MQSPLSITPSVGDRLSTIESQTPASYPKFIRLPRTGTREPFTGLSRSTLNRLILPIAGNGYKPPVKSICLRKQGATRGTRLILLDSLLAYLHGQAQLEVV